MSPRKGDLHDWHAKSYHAWDKENSYEFTLCPPRFPRTRKEHCSFPEGRKRPFSPSTDNGTRCQYLSIPFGSWPCPLTATAKINQESRQGQSNKKEFLWLLSYNCSSPIKCYLKFISGLALGHQWQKKPFSIWMSQQRWKRGRKGKVSVCKFSTWAAYQTLIKCILQVPC